MRRGDPIRDVVPMLQTGIIVDAGGKTSVDITAEVTEKLLDEIVALGGEVVSTVAEYDAIRAHMPLEQIEALAAWPEVRFVRPEERPVFHKTNTSQGDVAHRAAIARGTFGVDGSGVKICVLSDSVDHLAEVQATGDLPAVTILPGQSGTGMGEGTAMLEIVYDLAPGATLGFATAGPSPAEFARNIRDLRNVIGCHVIVDDALNPTEAVFQDGLIAQAVNDVVASGTVYFSSAGNYGNMNDGTSGVWEGDFVPLASFPGLGTVHDFGGSGLNQIGNHTTLIVLQWSDPFGRSSNDYDLYLYDPLFQLRAASRNSQNGTQDPFEFISLDGQELLGYWIVIVQKFGAANRFLHLTTLSQGGLSIGTAGQTFGHSATVGAFSVAAVDVATAGGGAFVGGAANPVETFSSDGPRRIFFNADGTPITPGNFSSTGGTVRQKPDIAAADGVATATPGFNPFHGTSAAAPHAAAIGGLLLSARPTLTGAQVREILTGTALDIEAPGRDHDSGFGILDAVAALAAVVTSTTRPPTSTTSTTRVTTTTSTTSRPPTTTTSTSSTTTTSQPPSCTPPPALGIANGTSVPSPGEFCVDVILNNPGQAIRAVQGALVDVPDEFQLVRVTCAARDSTFSCQANEVPGTNRINFVMVDLGGSCLSAGTGAIARLCFADRLPQCPTGNSVRLMFEPSSVQVVSCSAQPCSPSLFEGTITCGVLGDCSVDGAFNVFDVLAGIDIVLGRVTPTAAQRTLCDTTCDGAVNIFDVLRDIDGILGRIPTPLACPAARTAEEDEVR